MGFCVHIHVSVYVCTHVSVCVCVCVCVRVCVRVSAYMFVLYASIMRSESVCVWARELVHAPGRVHSGIHLYACTHPCLCVRVDCASVMGGLCTACASDLQPAFICISAYLCICMHELACMCMQAHVHIITI